MLEALIQSYKVEKLKIFIWYALKFNQEILTPEIAVG